MLSSCLFAQGRPAGSPWDRPELLYGSLALAAALFAGGFVIFLVDRWRKRGTGPGEAGVVELSGFRGMYERGEITEAEYNRLRQKVATRVKGPAGAAPAGGGAAPTSPVAADGTLPPAAPPLPGPLPDDYFDDPKPPAPPPPPG
jgi:hypothetical protein